MKRSFSLILCLCGLAAVASAQTGTVSVEGGSAFPFARITRDPLSGGMAGAGFASLQAPSWAAFRNAAAVPLSDMRLISGAVSYQNWMPRTDLARNIQGGVALKKDKLGFSLGFARQGYGSYDVYDAGGNAVGTFAPSDLQIALGCAYAPIAERLSTGFQLSCLRSNLDAGTSSTTVTLGFSTMWIREDLTLAAGFSHFGLPISDNQGKEFLVPVSFELGGQYRIHAGDKHAVRFLLDGELQDDGGLNARAGLEYSFGQLVFARAGYRAANDKSIVPAHAAAGFGVRWKGFSLDASYLFASEILEGSWALGLCYSF